MEKKTDLTTINTFPKNVSESEAVELLKSTDDEIESSYMKDVTYYPYLVATFQVKSSMMGQKDTDTVHCGVDLVNEKELLIDEKPSFKQKLADPSQILPKDCSQEAAIQTGRTYIREIVNRQLKPFRTPTIQCNDKGLIHRLFHVVEIKTTDGDMLQYAVDSVLGDYHRLYTEVNNPSH